MVDGGGPVPSGLERTVRSAPTAGGDHPTPDDYHLLRLANGGGGSCAQHWRPLQAIQSTIKSDE